MISKKSIDIFHVIMIVECIIVLKELKVFKTTTFNTISCNNNTALQSEFLSLLCPLSIANGDQNLTSDLSPSLLTSLLIAPLKSTPYFFFHIFMYFSVLPFSRMECLSLHLLSYSHAHLSSVGKPACSWDKTIKNYLKKFKKPISLINLSFIDQKARGK